VTGDVVDEQLHGERIPIIVADVDSRHERHIPILLCTDKAERGPSYERFGFRQHFHLAHPTDAVYEGLWHVCVPRKGRSGCGGMPVKMMSSTWKSPSLSSTPRMATMMPGEVEH
jgi:hypothetical protein